jgi:hypothetical protein
MSIANREKKKNENLPKNLSDEEKDQLKAKRKLDKQKKKNKEAQKLKLLKENQSKRKIIKREQSLQKKLEKEKNNLKLYSAKITAWISEEIIQKIAINTKYIKRADLKILPIPFLLTLAYTMYGNGSSTLALIASNMFLWFNISITPQALWDRMSNKETVMFLKNIFAKALTQQLISGLKNGYGSIFNQFTAVQIEDSTQFKLKETVKGKFKGSGGSASVAAMKLNTVYNITRHTISHLDIVSGSTSDQALSKNVRKLIKKGELWIRDLGYFNILDMLSIDDSKAYFLSRLKKGVNVYLNRDDTEPIDIYEFLEKKTENGVSFDKDVYVGEMKSRLKVRIIGEKVPIHVQQKRIESYKKNKIKRDKNKQMKKDYFEWFGYSIFITNVSREMFSYAEVIIAVYKIRWQIELFFKRIKSVLQIDIIKAESVNRVFCLVYAKLISLLMSQSILSYAASVCTEKELSEFKLMQWLKDNNRLGNAIISNEMEDLLIELINTLYLLAKNKRKVRKSTLRDIEEAVKQDFEAREKIDKIAS